MGERGILIMKPVVKSRHSMHTLPVRKSGEIRSLEMVAACPTSTFISCTHLRPEADKHRTRPRLPLSWAVRPRGLSELERRSAHSSGPQRSLKNSPCKTHMSNRRTGAV